MAPLKPGVTNQIVVLEVVLPVYRDPSFQRLVAEAVEAQLQPEAFAARFEALLASLPGTAPTEPGKLWIADHILTLS